MIFISKTLDVYKCQLLNELFNELNKQILNSLASSWFISVKA